MTSDINSYRKYIADQIEKVLLGFKPQICEESRFMELTLQQLRVLVLLCTEGPIRMSNISCRLGIGMPAVTSLVSKLEEKGLVTREHNTDDRRVVLCFATQQGTSEVERFWRVRREQINRVMGFMSEDELKIVDQAAEVILRVAKASEKTETSQNAMVSPKSN